LIHFYKRKKKKKSYLEGNVKRIFTSGCFPKLENGINNIGIG